MANRVAQQAADAAEQNAYRNYLNAVANTNIRRSEGEALDRYRQGELGIRGQDVMGINEYRRGQIGLGGRQIDMQTELGKQGLSNQLQDIINRGKYYEGIGQYYGAMPDVQRQQIGVQYDLGRKGLENQALDIGGSNRYREGMVGIGRLQAGTQAADVAGRNQNLANQIRAQLDLADRQLASQERIAGLQYERVPAYQKAMFDLYGANPQAAAAMMGVKPTEMDLLRESKRQEDEAAYNTAVMSAAQKALDQYQADQGWFNPDDESTTRMSQLMKNMGLTREQAARRYAEDVTAPLYGRGGSFSVQPNIAQPTRVRAGNTNLPPLGSFLK
jgi:hypothetical protein